MDRFLRDPQVKALLFGAVGSCVGKVGRIRNILEAAIAIVTEVFVVVVELDVRNERALGVRFPFVLVSLLDVPLLLGIVPLSFGFPDDAHVTSFDWLPE